MPVSIPSYTPLPDLSEETMDPPPPLPPPSPIWHSLTTHLPSPSPLLSTPDIACDTDDNDTVANEVDDELDNLIRGNSWPCMSEIRSWPQLRNDIDGIFKKQNKKMTLLLSHVCV
ncbi:hypothetical protein BS47DRAFT_1397487 [Hydnum rufescens UP504]|uniref:Uncharacterized protein n=1 Tax=Hydnum rufescens UP504 TaxID=1448309 RepID=A0A9P6ANE9_9AGAM|nr:hypothetical protein BS47DRAFT_1397487 [Hydnum rufescens UP504]